jgi:tetratricopeptide (TPR) repeat protein
LDLPEITRYQIIRQLGAGGMGEVFLAEDTRLERRVAIKMLPDKLAGDSHSRWRLIHEAKAAAALDHPNICAVYEVGEEGEQAFIVMQYVDGLNLAERIAKGPLSAVEVIDIGIQAAEALAEAHARGIIHRDIKPQNIILTPRGQLKVLDFGIAKFVEVPHAESPDARTKWATEAGIIRGTPGFMSPEQLRGQHVDARTDIFSLGALLYECAAGKSAFEAATPIDVALRVINHTPPPAFEVNPAIPHSLHGIISKAMAKAPSARYESAAALRSDLVALKQEIVAQSGLRSTVRAPVESLAAARGRLSWRSVPLKINVAAISVGVLTVLLSMVLLRNGRYVPSAEARSWYDRGTSAIREGAYFQASKALERAIEIDESFALARARLAEAYSEMEYAEKAKEELLQAIALIPDRSRISNTESLYLDGVTATLRRDFPSAIESYIKIAGMVAGGDRAAAYVDLGRAYEKNETVNKAIEAYVQASQLDPQYAAAFLRAAILHGREQNLPKANEAFAKAESIYQAMSSQEGLADVYYQRGSVLAKMRNVHDAKTQLERALEISRGSSNSFQSIRTQLQLSSVYYAEGDTDRAKKIAGDAIDAAQLAGIRSLATNGMIDLGYTLLSRGEFGEARAYFQQALDFARYDKTARTEARARLALGSLATQETNLEEAVIDLKAALEFYQRGGYGKETSNALILLGRAYRDKGDYEVALKTFSQQLEMAKQSGDAGQLAATHLSIGILLGTHEEKYADALSHLNESYRIDQSIGAKVGIGWDQLSRAAMLWQLGKYDEAQAALNEVRSIADKPEAAYKSIRAGVELTDAQIALSLAHYANAMKKGRAALDLSGKAYPDVSLQAKETIALAQAMSGTPGRAGELAAEAVTTAKELKTPRLVSTALLRLAEVLLHSNDANGALQHAQTAQGMFASAGQLESEWRAWLVAAQAERLVGSRSTAHDYALRAETQRRALESRWGAEDFGTYSRRPDIQAASKQLAQLARN